MNAVSGQTTAEVYFEKLNRRLTVEYEYRAIRQFSNLLYLQYDYEIMRTISNPRPYLGIASRILKSDRVGITRDSLNPVAFNND